MNFKLGHYPQGGIVDCIEIQERHASKLIKQPDKFRCVFHGDFLTVDPRTCPLYDRVVMNPPFARQDDIRHVLHAMKFLKPGGRLVAIMSAGVTYRDTKLNHEFNALNPTIKELPAGAFKSSGTMVRAIVAAIDKP